MNLNLQTNLCDPDRLESFLSGELSDAQEREFASHLNRCENCRRSLEQQAAEPESWIEAAKLLQPSKFDSFNADEVSDSGTVERPTRQPLQIQNVLDALGPTDDPEMLGRLGGYEVSGVVGAGGMGVVLKAIDKSLDRTVAIKVMAPHLATSGAARKRFAREAKAAAAVLHPNVIAIHSVSNDEALPYLVMPYVRGTSLQKRLDREGPLSLNEILRIGSQIAAGLAAAHAQGLVHRDIKPANILLEDGVERVTITDFGLARAVDDATITHSGVIAGTPQYMSPEQARGEAVEQRSDLFSLGTVLYAICTGRPPFRAETTYGVMRRITDDEPTSIREINPDIPDWLCSIIARLMSKRAENRFASAAEVTELLEKCLAHVQQPAAVPLPAVLVPPSKESRILSISRRSLGVIAMIAAFGLGLLGMALWQGAEVPDIGGQWSGEGWGEVVLEQKQPGEYEGTYTDTFKDKPGTIQVKWSRLEDRFNGTWREGKDRHGKISVRLVDDEIRGAWKTNKKSNINPGTPELADLLWKRSSGIPDKSKSIIDGSAATPIELRIITPEKMVVAVAGPREQFDKSLRLEVPAKLNLAPGKTYRLKLSEIPGRPGLELYPTIEIPEANPQAAEFLKRSAIPLELAAEDFDLLATRGSDTFFKVVFLNKRTSKLQTMISCRNDTLDGAAQSGAILCILRIGNTDPADEKPTAQAPPQQRTASKQTDEGITSPERLNYFTTGHSIKVACSADGKLIAVANGNPTRIMQVGGTSRVKGNWKPTADILDAKTGKIVVSLKLTTNDEDAVLAATERSSHVEAGALAFSPAGDVVAVGTSVGQVKLFHARTGELIRSLDDEPAKLADKKTPENWRSFKRAMGSVASLTFSPDGSLLATCGSSFREFSGGFDNVDRLTREVTGSGRLKVWEVKTGTLKQDLVGHTYADTAAFSPDGNLLASAGRWSSASDNGAGVIIWNPQTGAKIRTITNEADVNAHAVTFSPNGKMVVIGSEPYDKQNAAYTTAVRLTNVVSGITQWQQKVPSGANPKAFSPDGKSVLVLCGQSIRFLDAETGTVQREIKSTDLSKEGRWDDLAISPQGPRLVIGAVDEEEGNVELWDFDGSGAAPNSLPVKATPKRVHRFQTSENVKTIACSSDGKLIAIANGNPTFPLADGWKRSVEILDAETGKTVVSLKLTTDEEGAVLTATEGFRHFEVEALAFSPDGNVVAVGTGIGQVKLFHARTGELMQSLNDEPAKLAEKKTPEKLKSLARAMGSVASLAFSADGSLLAMCGSSMEDVPLVFETIRRTRRSITGPGRLLVWDVKTATLQQDLVGHDRHANGVAFSFSPDGNLLASAGSWLGSGGSDHGSGVILWNPQTGAMVRTILIDTNGGTWSVAFSPNGKLLAVSSRTFDKDNDTSTSSISLLRAGTGILEWRQTIPGWGQPVVFSPDGNSVAVLCGGHSIQWIDAETGVMKYEIKSADFLPSNPRQGGRWNTFAITPQGPTLAIGGVDREQKGSVELWDFEGPGTAATSAPPVKDGEDPDGT